MVVNDGVVLGEGFTLPPGQSHAEVVALQRAGDGAHGASMYITLEPCPIYGRTPPCTDAIKSAGIKEVHVAVTDPNTQVKGKGLKELEAAGITVYAGDGETEARELYEAYGKHINTGMPFVTAKFAMSLDGKIATHTGDSKWITGAAARMHVHEMRSAYDAIAIGVNTLIRDNPHLTARDEQGQTLPQQPLRVILDSKARTPPDALILTEPGQTIIAVTKQAGTNVSPLEQAGAEVLQIPSTSDGVVDPRALLEILGARGVVSLLVEGGGTLLGSLFDLGLVDKVAAFISPQIIGGHSAPSPVGGKGIANVSQVLKLKHLRTENLGEDILVVGYTSNVLNPPWMTAENQK